MRSLEDGLNEGYDRSRGGWALLWRLYRWSTRNCRPDDLTAEETARNHPRKPADALA